MKKLIYSIMMAAAVIAAVSCEKEAAIETENTQEASSELVQWSFTADMPQTKTTLAPAGSVTWDAEDEIALWYLDGTNAPKSVIAKTETGGANATFTASIPAEDTPDHFWAAYPATAGELTYDGTEKFTITVKESDGSFKKANYMAAYSTASAKSFAFKHAVGIIKLSLPESGVISHGGTDYTIARIRVKGKETSIRSIGTVEVTQSAGVVSGFSENTTGTQSSSIALSDAVRASGTAYIPCYPGEFTHGLSVRYYSEDGHIPAVLTKDQAITVTRGHVLPLIDFSAHITWDYYVSADGSGNGKTSETPMSLTSLQAMLTEAGNYMFKANLLTGTTIHFAAGTYNLDAAISFPNLSEMTHINFEGNGAVLDGQGACRIIEITGRFKKLSFTDFTIQNGNHASKGGAIYVAPNATTTDENLVIDFKNCLITGNSVTSGNGGAVAVDAGPAGQIRFDNCRFQNNTVTGQAGAVYLYPNCGAAAMFNKCTFMGNTGTSNTMTIGINCNSTKDENHGRLGMNNCTVNVGNKTFSSNGSALTVKGYSVIANSTIWNSGTFGKWGHIALGANRVAQELDANAANVVNCLIRNNNDTYKAFYLHGSYYQNINYCLYTGLTEASGATKDGAEPTYTLNNSADIDRAVEGAAAKNTTVNGIQAYHYTFTADFSSAMTFPTETQVRDIIEGTTNIGPLFLGWLDTLENALTTDITGYDRDPDALHPGSWQKR